MVYMLAQTHVCLDKSLCLFGLNVLVATGIQFVNASIEPLEQGHGCEAMDRQEPLVTTVENCALMLFALLPPLLYGHHCVFSSVDMKRSK